MRIRREPGHFFAAGSSPGRPHPTASCGWHLGLSVPGCRTLRPEAGPLLMQSAKTIGGLERQPRFRPSLVLLALGRPGGHIPPRKRAWTSGAVLLVEGEVPRVVDDRAELLE